MALSISGTSVTCSRHQPDHCDNSRDRFPPLPNLKLKKLLPLAFGTASTPPPRITNVVASRRLQIAPSKGTSSVASAVAPLWSRQAEAARHPHPRAANHRLPDCHHDLRLCNRGRLAFTVGPEAPQHLVCDIAAAPQFARMYRDESHTRGS